MTVWLDLNLSSLIIFFPTVGVIDRITQSHVFMTSWLFFAIFIELNFFFNFLAVSLFLGDIVIFLWVRFDLKIPVITAVAIFPVPIKPIFITLLIVANLYF